MITRLLQNGTDISQYIEQGTWRVDQQLSRQGTRCTLYLYSETPISVAPLDQFVLFDPDINATIFSGLAIQIQRQYPGPNAYYTEVLCIDWTYFLDRRHVNGQYGNTTAGTIISQLLQQYPLPITTNHVQSGPILQTVKFHHLTFSKALTKLVQLCSSSTTNWAWFVDYQRDLHFFDMATASFSPYYLTDSLSDANPMAVRYKRAGHQQLTVITDASDLRTTVVVRGGSAISSPHTDSWVGNGQTSSFPLTYTPYSNTQASQYQAPTLTVGGTSKTVAFDTGQSGQTAQWLLSANTVGQWFLRTNTDPTPGNGVVVALTYVFELPVETAVSDLGAVATYQNAGGTGHDGKFEVVLEDSTITDGLTAISRATSHLRSYAWAENQILVETEEHSVCHFDAGQQVYITCQQAGLNRVPYLIVANTITGQPGNYRTYTLHGIQVSPT